MDEITRLQKIIRAALEYYRLESGDNEAKILPLNDVITLDTADTPGNVRDYNIETYAVTENEVVCWRNNEKVPFTDLDSDDIYTLQDIVADEYDLDIPEYTRD